MANPPRAARQSAAAGYGDARISFHEPVISRGLCTNEMLTAVRAYACHRAIEDRAPEGRRSATSAVDKLPYHIKGIDADTGAGGRRFFCPVHEMVIVCTPGLSLPEPHTFCRPSAWALAL
jgi:hypothetical protein